MSYSAEAAAKDGRPFLKQAIASLQLFLAGEKQYQAS
jgi:hypothetical protein